MEELKRPRAKVHRMIPHRVLFVFASWNRDLLVEQIVHPLPLLTDVLRLVPASTFRDEGLVKTAHVYSSSRLSV
jgi:hypothetical protein